VAQDFVEIISEIPYAELLNISQDGEANGVLLGVSVLLQGHRTEAETSKLLAGMSNDLRDDGVLSDSSLGSALLDHAVALDLNGIRNNLTDKYSELGLAADIPAFENHVTNFILNTNFSRSQLIGYPTVSQYGENLLDTSRVAYAPAIHYSLAAELPDGMTIEIVLRHDDGAIPLDEGFYSFWDYVLAPEPPINWFITKYDTSKHMQLFSSIETGKDCDVKLRFIPTGVRQQFVIEYFENGEQEPTRIKRLTVE
jgi:hypothetical protein